LSRDNRKIRFATEAQRTPRRSKEAKRQRSKEAKRQEEGFEAWHKLSPVKLREEK
jgi:hypothetical protein